MKWTLASGALSIVGLVVVYVLTGLYVYLFPSYDLSTFIVGAAIPLTASILIPLATGSRVLLYAFLAFYWALVDDAPVFLDSVFTWPEVTRFHPIAPHLFLEALYHLLTAAFLVLTVREAARGKAWTASKAAWVSLLASSAFFLAYAQNVPLPAVQSLVDTSWYQFDVMEHALSALLLYLAVRAAGLGEMGPESKTLPASTSSPM